MSGFWREVRARIWQKARELYLADMLRSDPLTPPPLIMPKDKELREAGYFNRAKVSILHELGASANPTDQEFVEEDRKPENLSIELAGAMNSPIRFPHFAS